MSSSPLNAHQFFTDNHVIFLTGGTGFVGKAVVEKLLRSFPQVSKIFMLIRASGTQSLQSRVKAELFDSPICDTLKDQFESIEDFYATIEPKVIPIQGDIARHHLGMSDQDYKMVQQETHIIINAAASIKFNDPLAMALDLNTKSTLRMLEMAYSMPNLTSVVHVSTAYVDALAPGIFEEKLLPFPLGDPVQLYEDLQNMSAKELTAFEKIKIPSVGFPNTYTFAKSLAEQLMTAKQQQRRLPIVYCRPSVIIGALSEPMPGWVEGFAMGIGMSATVALGQLQEWIGVPCALIAPESRFLSLPPVYNATTSDLPQPMTWGSFASHCKAHHRAVVPPKKRVNTDIRFDFYSPKEFHERHEIRFGAILRANPQDFINPQDWMVAQKRARFAKLFASIYEHFASYSCMFKSPNSKSLDVRAPMELKCGLQEGIDWKEFMVVFNSGIVKYLLNENTRLQKPISYDDEDFYYVKSEPRPELVLDSGLGSARL